MHSKNLSEKLGAHFHLARLNELDNRFKNNPTTTYKEDSVRALKSGLKYGWAASYWGAIPGGLAANHTREGSVLNKISDTCRYVGGTLSSLTTGVPMAIGGAIGGIIGSSLRYVVDHHLPTNSRKRDHNFDNAHISHKKHSYTKMDPKRNYVVANPAAFIAAL